MAGSDDHAFLIYGGDYDRDGKPIAYLIKDSLAPLTRRADADEVHRTLNDVTVAAWSRRLPTSTPPLARERSDPCQKQERRSERRLAAERPALRPPRNVARVGASRLWGGVP